MKKFLCILLSILMLLSFAACESDEDDDDDRSSRRSKKSQSSTASDYEDAIEAAMKLASMDITKKELKSMFPDACWDYLEEEANMTFDEWYEMASEAFADERADLEDEFGEDVKLQYEILNKNEVDEEEFDEFKGNMKEYFGIKASSIGECYEVELEATMSGEYEEETEEMTWHVVEIDGSWYVAEVFEFLLEGF